MKRLAIMGASGHGKVVAETAELNKWDEIVFFDDAWPNIIQNGPWPVSGNFSILKDKKNEFDGILVAIGNNVIRILKYQELIGIGAEISTLIHPDATVSKYADIGQGSVIFAKSVINAGTRLGLGCIVNTSATIDHDCLLGQGVHLSPGSHLAGGVKVGDLSWIGIGACVRELIEIGNRVIVGAGAVVVKNISENQMVAGVPAEPLVVEGKV